jgi:hypothetical protein
MLSPEEAESRWDLRERGGGDGAITLHFKEYLWPDRIKTILLSGGQAYHVAKSVAEAPICVPRVSEIRQDKIAKSRGKQLVPRSQVMVCLIAWFLELTQTRGY